ncbi:hypothetical protein KFK09_015000 [Dendrobium nobile]|uniref:Uncharacterized protein n=1 Tax=Dendrobium nobile TaxID=94219 RepID=A0A8T3B5Z2_DENNO|nr:hypothetical protein KFK09_015000 [Dendrobium nobile]
MASLLLIISELLRPDQVAQSFSLWEETSAATAKKASEFSYGDKVEDASLLTSTAEDLNCLKVSVESLWL